MIVQSAPQQISAVVLGNMQDGGLPHVGCRCQRCAAVFEGDRQPLYAACLAIVDERQLGPKVWLIDATPDIKFQINLLSNLLGPHVSRSGRLRQPDGIFLTHAHMGHIGGLPQLGPEAMSAHQLPVYAAPGLTSLLNETRLWQPLAQNLELVPLPANVPVSLSPDLTITPVPVPHRDEWGIGTFAFHIQGPNRSLLYVPDIDAWEDWPLAREQIASADIALVDGCFHSQDEIGGRPPVAHPLIPHTLELFADLECRLVITHLNHTNPVLDLDSAEYAAVLSAGAAVAHTGQRFSL